MKLTLETVDHEFCLFAEVSQTYDGRRIMVRCQYLAIGLLFHLSIDRPCRHPLF